MAREALAKNGALLVVRDLDEAFELAERIAPEHLQLVGRAEDRAVLVRRAGAVFVGESTPEVFGDYLIGPSHVLPTAGSARFSSGLSADSFVRRLPVMCYQPEAAARVAEAAAILADAEGLPAHARAARLRAPAPTSDAMSPIARRAGAAGDPGALALPPRPLALPAQARPERGALRPAQGA